MKKLIKYRALSGFAALIIVNLSGCAYLGSRTIAAAIPPAIYGDGALSTKNTIVVDNINQGFTVLAAPDGFLTVTSFVAKHNGKTSTVTGYLQYDDRIVFTLRGSSWQAEDELTLTCYSTFEDRRSDPAVFKLKIAGDLSSNAINVKGGLVVMN